MANIICRSKVHSDNMKLFVLSAVSPSFFKALPAVISTVCAEKGNFGNPMSGTESNATLFPTFKFNRSIFLYVSSDEDRSRMMKCMIPSFPHLKLLKLEHKRHPLKNGVELARFIRQFSALDTFHIFLHPTTTAPSEFLDFFVTLIFEENTNNNNNKKDLSSRCRFMTSLLSSFCGNLIKFRDEDTIAQVCYLLVQHGIIQRLQDKMMEYRKLDDDEGGRTVSRFLEVITAICQTLIYEDEEGTKLKQLRLLDVLAPTLELVEKTLVQEKGFLDGRYLPYVGFLSKERLTADERKWKMLQEIIAFVECFCSQPRLLCRDFISRYGCAILSKLTEFFNAQRTGTGGAADNFSEMMVRCLAGLLACYCKVIPDFFWMPSNKWKGNEAHLPSLHSMIKSGRRAFEHVPFELIAFAIKASSKYNLQPNTAVMCLQQVHSFLKTFLDGEKKLKEYPANRALIEDVSVRMNNAKILPALFEFSRDFVKARFCDPAGCGRVTVFPLSAMGILKTLLLHSDEDASKNEISLVEKRNRIAFFGDWAATNAHEDVKCDKAIDEKIVLLKDFIEFARVVQDRFQKQLFECSEELAGLYQNNGNKKIDQLPLETRKRFLDVCDFQELICGVFEILSLFNEVLQTAHESVNSFSCSATRNRKRKDAAGSDSDDDDNSAENEERRALKALSLRLIKHKAENAQLVCHSALKQFSIVGSFIKTVVLNKNANQ